MSIILKDESLAKLLEEQIAHEMGNHVLYKNLASLCKDKGLKNSEDWFEAQASEELVHANLIRTFMNDVGYAAMIKTEKIGEQDVDQLETMQDIFLAALKREEETTERINKIVKAAHEAEDFVTRKFAEDLLYIQRSEIDEATDRHIATQLSSDDLIVDTYIGDLSE